MKEIVFTSKMQVIADMSQLSTANAELMQAAIGQLDVAYAPYSRFHVGAAVRLANDEFFLGSNQENASYPLCICGERTALFAAANYHPDVPMVSLAIVAKNLSKTIDQPVSPCGACRQVILEYEQRHQHDIEIFLKADGPEIYRLLNAKSLLPFGFDNSFL